MKQPEPPVGPTWKEASTPRPQVDLKELSNDKVSTHELQAAADSPVRFQTYLKGQR